MNGKNPLLIVRPVHQWTGVTLFVLILAKLLSGYSRAGYLQLFDQQQSAWLHFSKWIDIPLLIGFCFHGFYGFMRLFLHKVSNKWMVFYIFTGLAALCSLLGVWMYFKG